MQYRGRIHVWSLAILTPKRHARGHRIAQGVVLPGAAIEHPIFRRLFDGEALAVAHNAPHDVHAAKNHGTDVVRWRCTLQRARVLIPGLDSYGLKSLCGRVGRRLHTFEETLDGKPVMKEIVTTTKHCECNDLEWQAGLDVFICNRRGKGHKRIVEKKFELVEVGTQLWPLEEVVPGHPRWKPLVEYAGEDAVTGVELDDHMDLMIDEEWYESLPPVPWSELAF